MKGPLISIIVPVYNVESYLSFCLDSIIQQSYHNLEIILVNDGSKDNSQKICENYLYKDERIVLINQENKGLSGARNVGIDYCHGKFITFIDSDDYICEDYIEYLYYLILKTNTKLGLCDSKIVKDYNTCNYEKSNGSIKMLSQKDFIKMSLHNSKYLSAWGKIYSIELFENIRFPIGKLNEDIFIMGDIIKNEFKIVYGTSKKYMYVKRKNSITTSKFNEKKFDLIEAGTIYSNIVLLKYSDLEMDAFIFKNHLQSSLIKQISFKQHYKYKKYIIQLIEESRMHLPNILKKQEVSFLEKGLIIVNSTGFLGIKFFWIIFDSLRRR